MPTISVEMFAGRTRAQHEEFVRRVTEAAVTALGVPPEKVKIRITEVSPHLTAVGGSFLAEPPAQ